MVQHLLGRRGAARISLIPPEVLEPRPDCDRQPERIAGARLGASQAQCGTADRLGSCGRAVDGHAGHVGHALDEAIDLLQPWVHDGDTNIRRFASELTRPRGVWCGDGIHHPARVTQMSSAN
jgi:hypothetical protein